MCAETGQCLPILNKPKLFTDFSIIVNGDFLGIPFFITTDYKLINSIREYKNMFNIESLRPVDFLNKL